MGKLRYAATLVLETFAAYRDDNISREAAALAYFGLFALVPLLIVLLEVAALLVGGSGNERQLRGSIIEALSRGAGAQSAQVIDGVLRATLKQARHGGIVAGLLSWVVFVLAATGLLGAIQGALDDLWHVTRSKQPWWGAVKDRLVAVALIAAAALVLMISLAVNTRIAATVGSGGAASPLAGVATALIGSVLSLAAIAAIFSATFKFLPHTAIAWRSAVPGGVVAAVFFTIGQLALSWYLGRAGTASAFGAAGSLVVLVLWMYYSAQIFLLGAEFTKVYAAKGALAIE